MATEERALRAELDALARKKEQIQAKRRTSGNRGNGDRPTGNSDSQYSRANNGSGNGSSSAAQRRGSGGSAGSGDRRLEGGRAGKRPNERNPDMKKGDDDISRKRPRLSSDDAKDSPRAGGEARKADAPKENTANEREKRRAVATYAQKDGLARSRRMFGALMGHLGKAKAMIEKDSTLLKKQTSKQHEAEQKEKEQSKALEIKAKRDATVSRLEDLIATAEIEMQELVARTKLQHLQQARKGASLSRFLLTVASPPIYYLPKKHTKETEDLVATSVEAHEEKMVLSNREHQTKLREIESEYTAKIEKYKLELEEATRELGGDQEKKEAKDNEEAPAPVNEDTERAESKDESIDPAKNEETQEEETHVASPAPASAMQTSEASPGREQPASSERAASRKRSAVPDEAEEADELNKRTKRESVEEEVVDAVEKPTTPDAVEEPKLANSPPPPQPTTAKEAPAVDTTAKVVEATEEPSAATAQKQKMDVSKLRVTDLREELKKRGLDTKGNKPVLVQRLEEALNEEA